MKRFQKEQTLTLMDWFGSNRNLDICSLAVCSCVLTVLCHQVPVALSSSAVVTGMTAPVTRPIANLSEIDLTLKAGLFTTSQTEKTQQLDE